jgi:hypothetical protein
MITDVDLNPRLYTGKTNPYMKNNLGIWYLEIKLISRIVLETIFVCTDENKV